MLDTKNIVGNNLVPYLRNADVQWDRINTVGLPKMDIAPQEYGRYTLKAGDLLVCEGGEVGRAAIWKGDLPICGFQKALHRLRPLSRGEVPRFLLYLLQVASKSGAFDDGHTSTIQHLTGDKLRAHRFPFPSSQEQAAIVRFLDYADRRIRRYIAAKRKLIALLNEQKQAIIHRAVTRGLDPGVRLKPSGVEWLGEVPAHWEVGRLKGWITPIEQGWSPQCDAQPAGPDEWGVLKVGCVNRDYFDPSQNKRLPANLSPAPELEIRRGDILVSRANTRQLLGLASIVDDVRPRLLLCDKLFRFRIDLRSNAHFFVCAIRSKPSRVQIESSTTGASDSMQNIGQGTIRNLWMAVPPLDEQQQIVEAIAGETELLSRSLRKSEREIDLLHEYRTRLIADIVTGKLDVREAAARLPEEGGELEPLEEAEEQEEGADEDEALAGEEAG